jgi:ABC-type Fe3+-siderophore transport system permease subunit
VLVALRLGDVPLDWGQLVAGVFGRAGRLADGIVWFRLPRIVAAAAAGACLAGAGVAIQSVVRNPLAEPSLLGVTGGSSIGAVALITLVPTAPRWGIPAAALVGGVLALAVVVGLATGGGTLDATRVVLVGIGVAASVAAVVQILSLRAQLQLAAALTWLAGSTYARSVDDLSWFVLPVVLLVGLVLVGRVLDLLALGEDLPRSLGLPVRRARLVVLLAGAVLAAGTAAVVGTVGFVGLVAPHLARRLVGAGHRRVLPVAALLGAVLVVAADALGRWVLAPNEIPVGVVTALVGAPYLVWLLRRQRNHAR